MLNQTELTLEEVKEKIEELEKKLKEIEGTECEVYSRVVGYHRPVKNWNLGKKEEFKERKTFDIKFNEE